MSQAPIFLTIEHVLRLHDRQIKKFGGAHGIRDLELIKSAIAQPYQEFDGQYLHKTLPEMAAAYWFHLTQNHGFVDGNKRIGASSALIFLEMNGIDTNQIDETAMEAMTMAIAAGKADKKMATAFFLDRIHGDE